MIALVGATGTIGRHVAAGLAQAGAPARALTRRRAGSVLPPGIDAVDGDLRDPSAVRRFLDGADQIFLLTPHGPDQAVMEAGAIDAAAALRVRRVVKLSGTAATVGPNGPSATAIAHWRSEQRIEASGLRFYFLRPSFLMQSLLAAVAPTVARTGVLAAPFSRAPIAMVDARDVAAAAVAALLDDRLPDDAVALTGPRGVTFAEIAREVGVPYIAIPPRLAATALRARGSDAWEVRHVLHMAAFLGSGADGAPADGVRRLTGTPPRTVHDFLAEHAAAFGGLVNNPRRTWRARLLPHAHVT